MRNLLTRRSPEAPQPQETDYKGMEGQRDWAGPWQLNRGQMIWWRPEHYYFKSPRDGITRQNQQIRMGPMIRPGVMHLVGQHIDEVPLVAVHSHPEEPGLLPEFYEGAWMDTNPAWPEMTVRTKLGGLGVELADDMPRDETETFDLTPSMTEGLETIAFANASSEAITLENSIPFDPTPLSLSATVLYVRSRR